MLQVPLRLAVGVVLLTMLLAPGVLAAQRPAFFCKLAPGTSYVEWRDETQATRLEIAWNDADGTVIASRTVITAEERRTNYRQKTPEGATDFGVTFYDATGVAYAVGGMACQ
jgi:hypothetical protein